MDSKIKLANISDKTSSLSCHMFPWQRLYLSNCEKFSSMVGHFKISQLQGSISQLQGNNSIAHMFRIIKKVVKKKGHVFHAPDNLCSNKEVNIHIISNVMTLLTLRFKVQTVYSFKTSYFHE